MFRADKRRIKGCLQTKRYDRTGRKQYVRPMGGGVREMCERGFINYVVQEKKAFCLSPAFTPKGSIVRKIGVMGYLPELDKSINKFITMSRDEYANFVEDTIQLVIQQFVEKKLM